MRQDEQVLHAVIFPYPGQGHINPLMQLAIRLASEMGFYVTFVCAAGNHRSILESWAKQGMDSPLEQQGLKIRMASIPDDCLPPRTMKGIFEFLAGTRRLRDPLEEFLQDLVQDRRFPPVKCIVSDTIMIWVQDVAQKFGIAWVPYFPLPTSSFLTMCHAPALAAEGKIPWNQDGLKEDDVLEIPGSIPFHRVELPMIVMNPSDRQLKGTQEQNERILRAPWLFINTCETLEHEVLESVRNLGYHNVLPMAPLLPASFLQDDPSDSDLVVSSLWEQDSSCLQWLDQQAPRSILYVSFGSISGMPFADLEKLLEALVRSEVRFLWVLRLDLALDVPEGATDRFLQRTASHGGMIVRWGPQLKILRHSSIAVFLTHCGWNSTFEGICAELPMICWPCFAEQKLNARYIVDYWKIGAIARKNPISPISQDHLEQVIVGMMRGEQGNAARDRVRELSAACKKEFAENNRLKIFADGLRRWSKDSQNCVD